MLYIVTTLRANLFLLTISDDSRTMKDKLIDKPIVELPLDHRSLRVLEAKPSEHILFLAIEVRLRELRQKDFNKKDERIRLRNRLAQLTRLRQYVNCNCSVSIKTNLRRLTANADIVAQQIIVWSTRRMNPHYLQLDRSFSKFMN